MRGPVRRFCDSPQEPCRPGTRHATQRRDRDHGGVLRAFAPLTSRRISWAPEARPSTWTPYCRHTSVSVTGGRRGDANTVRAEDLEQRAVLELRHHLGLMSWRSKHWF